MRNLLKDDDVVSFLIDKGTVIHVNGIPLRTEESCVVNGAYANRNLHKLPMLKDEEAA